MKKLFVEFGVVETGHRTDVQSNGAGGEEFFHGTSLKSNFLMNLGYADTTKIFRRLPRFEFEDVCQTI